MRIAFIAASEVPSRTANSIQVMKVCDSFRSLGHEVKLYLPGADPKTPWSAIQSHYGISADFSISWLRSFKFLRRYDFAARAILAGRFWKADYFYVWTLQAAAFASILGLPTILEMHDRPPGRFGPTLFRNYLKGVGAVRLLPITHSLSDWLSKAYAADFQESIVEIAPMGVDLEAYVELPVPEQAREELGLKPGITAGYTGHLYPGRGVELLFELAQRYPDINYLWIGGEPEAVVRWKRIIDDRGVGNIQILGHVENKKVPSYQAACDFLLMPYQKSISVSSGGDTAQFASPMKVFEYLATGRPILSSDLPVLREVLSEKNAVLLPAEDTHAWVRALRQLVEDPERRELLAQQGREDASRYTWTERAKKSLENLAR